MLLGLLLAASPPSWVGTPGKPAGGPIACLEKRESTSPCLPLRRKGLCLVSPTP